MWQHFPRSCSGPPWDSRDTRRGGGACFSGHLDCSKGSHQSCYSHMSIHKNVFEFPLCAQWVCKTPTSVDSTLNLKTESIKPLKQKVWVDFSHGRNSRKQSREGSKELWGERDPRDHGKEKSSSLECWTGTSKTNSGSVSPGDHPWPPTGLLCDLDKTPHLSSLWPPVSRMRMLKPSSQVCCKDVIFFSIRRIAEFCSSVT